LNQGRNSPRGLSARLSKYEKGNGKTDYKKYNKSISGDLTSDIRRLIETARQNVAVTVNTGLTILYPDRRKSRL